MEMTASFTQTADGLDAWGHDIIFEFAGDDDMFLFVDDVLVLDLGGVHAAQVGKVNFRTGAITGSGVNNNNNTLLKVFTNSYKAQHQDWTQDSLNEWLGGIFKKDSKGNLTSVFQDYSTHTMRMIYMERGAGASNLHMRFNLAAVKPGTVQLGKTLSGVDTEDSVNAEFPYQIWYSTRPIEGDEPIRHLLGAKTGEPDLVKYVGSSRNVKYAASYTINGVADPYEHVFFLKPDEVAEIMLPEGALQYKIVECGVNPNIYDRVKVNDEVITGTEITGSTKEDYWTSAATLSERNSVTYDNHIREGAMRTLTFTKHLYDVAGNPIPYSDSDAVFNFRLYLGGENDAELSAAHMQAYHVKDNSGNYCRWDNTTGTFASIGKTDYAALTPAEKEQVTFHSSPNGAISYIPVDYTVEVRQILVGSGYKVVERDYEVPEGYSWKGYKLTYHDDSGQEFTVTVTDKTKQMDGIGGIIHENDDPSVIVQNYKGWGITVKKVWTDADFMESHDTIYFAVYTDDGSGNLTLVDGTVRPMPTTATSLYWYFDQLTNGVNFDHHVIREVTISETNPTPNEDGFIEDPGTVTPIVDRSTLDINATPIIDHTAAPYTYTVSYAQGSLDDNHDNIRTDTVTNSRPGIEIRKTDQSGTTPLPGATFTLKTEGGTDVGEESFTSGQDGLVTIAYLPDGTFVLTETVSPAGYSGISQPLTITKSGETITLSGLDQSEYTYSPATGTSNAVITVKDRPFYLRAIKENAQNVPLQGVHFALYRQVKATSGQLIKDYYPIAGYEDLVTDNEGIIPRITSELGHGTYYLVETQALEEYQPLDTDICFTISDTGTVTIIEGNDRRLTQEENADGTISYTITVTNATAWKKLQFKKVDIARPHQSSLADAHFDLYAVINGERQEEPLYQNLVSGSNGILAFEKTTEDESGQPVTETVTVFELPVGVYHLIEIQAPAGYNIKTDPVVITVASTRVSYDEGTVLSQSESGIIRDAENRLYTLLISNSSGYELPSTGGIGTRLICEVGAIMTLLAGAVLFQRKRKIA